MDGHKTKTKNYGDYAIGSRIRDLREAKGITQEELADKIKEITGEKLGRSAVKNWEIGHRAINSTHISALCDCLDVTSDEILKGIKPENKDIVAYSGLTEKALEVLHNSKAEVLDIISVLLENGQLVRLAKHLNQIKRFSSALSNSLKDGADPLPDIDLSDFPNIPKDDAPSYPYDEAIDDDLRDLRLEIFDLASFVSQLPDELYRTEQLISDAKSVLLEHGESFANYSKSRLHKKEEGE